MAAVDPTSVLQDSTLEDTAAALGAYLDQQLAIETSLKHALEACRARVQRARKAIEVLAPEATAQEKAASTATKKRTRRRGPGPGPTLHSTNWVPSDEIIAKTLKALEELSSEHKYVSLSQLAKRTGMAQESLKRALIVLRDREQARFLGRRDFPTKTAGRTVKAMAFKVMPTHEPEADGLAEGNVSAFVGALTEASD